MIAFFINTVFKTWCERFYRLSSRKLKDKVFFLHVPKCGGTSVKLALKMTTQSDRCHFLDPVSSKACAKAMGLQLFKYREQILLYLMASPQLNFIGGHFRWSDKAYELFGDQWNYVTILRNPIDKWFSQYFYNRYKASNHYHIQKDIEEFVDSAEGQRLGRDQIQKLSDPSTPPEKQLKQAAANLERFALVGMTERLDLFRDNFKKRFGVRLMIPHANKNPAMDIKNAALAKPKIRKKVRQICSPDLELHEKVIENLDLKF